MLEGVLIDYKKKKGGRFCRLYCDTQHGVHFSTHDRRKAISNPFKARIPESLLPADRWLIINNIISKVGRVTEWLYVWETAALMYHRVASVWCRSNFTRGLENNQLWQISRLTLPQPAQQNNKYTDVNTKFGSLHLRSRSLTKIRYNDGTSKLEVFWRSGNQYSSWVSVNF